MFYYKLPLLQHKDENDLYLRRTLTEHQLRGSYNQLQDLLEEHGGDVGTITNDEIIGRYELVTKHIYPDDFLDLI